MNAKAPMSSQVSFETSFKSRAASGAMGVRVSCSCFVCGLSSFHQSTILLHKGLPSAGCIAGAAAKAAAADAWARQRSGCFLPPFPPPGRRRGGLGGRGLNTSCTGWRPSRASRCGPCRARGGMVTRRTPSTMGWGGGGQVPAVAGRWRWVAPRRRWTLNWADHGPEY